MVSRKNCARALLSALAISLMQSATWGVEDAEPFPTGEARKLLRELGRERAGAFVGIAIGSALALGMVSALHMLWRKSPLAARIVSAGLLAFATAHLLGEFVLAGSAPALAGAGIVWLFLAGALASVFRVPSPQRRSIGQASWLKIPAKLARPHKEAKPVEPREAPSEAVEEAFELIEAGRVEEAIEALRKELATRRTKRAHLYLGTILGARGQAEEALRELDRALELDPSYAEALSEKAYILDRMGRTAEAAAVRESRAKAMRSRRPAGKVDRSEVLDCPACGKKVATGAERCECGLDLKRCASCGEEKSELRAHSGRLLCAECRMREAASRAKPARLLKQALSARELPPWVVAAAFAAAVATGAAGSPAYIAWREHSCAERMRALLQTLSTLLERAETVTREELDELDARAAAELSAHPFARDRAASLRMILALYGLRRSSELHARGEIGLAKFASEWAQRQLEQAEAILDAKDRQRLPENLSKAFTEVRDAFERELQQRSIRAAAMGRPTSEEAPPVQPEDAKRNWRSIWTRPEPDTVFHIEVFRRVSIAAVQDTSVGIHKDGSPVAAVRLLRCRVEQGEGLILYVESIPFEIRKLSEPPEGLPPAVRLLPVQGREVADRKGPWRIAFSSSLGFKKLEELSERGSTLAVEDAYASREFPRKELPLFAPGIDEGWGHDERLLWPYGGASQERGPCVKQIARWLTGPDGRERVSLAWLLRYEPATKKYVERIIQSWTCGRIWWDFYDDEVAFFRTVFPGQLEDGSK